MLHSRVFFTKFLVGGTCFLERFSVPGGDRVRWGHESRQAISLERGMKLYSETNILYRYSICKSYASFAHE